MGVKGSLVVLFGEPGSGKSYAMRAVYSALAVLDSASRRVCGVPRFRVEVSREGVEWLGRLLAALAYAAVDARESPAVWASRAGLRLSRFTVRARGRGVGSARSISVEVRLRRDSQFVIAGYKHGSMVSSYVDRVRGCVSGLLLPWGSRFRVEPVDGGRLVDPSILGSRRVRVLDELEVRVPGMCRIVAGPVWVEAVYEEGRVVVRGVEVEELEAEEACLGVSLDELARRVVGSLPLGDAGRALSRGLVRSVAAASSHAVSESTGCGDVLYLAFVRSAALWLRAAAARLGPLGARRLRRLLRYPETAAMGLVYARIEEGLRRGVPSGAESLLSLLAGGEPSVEEGVPLFDDERSGARLPVHMASALASEMTALMLALRSPRGRPLVLLEEPEAQLHPRLQVGLAVILPALAETLGGTIVFSTHSDLLVSALAAASSLAGREGMEERLAGFLRRLGIQAGAEEARLAAAALRRGVRFYLFRGGRVEEVEPTRLQAEAPSYTPAYDALLELLPGSGVAEADLYR